MKSRVLSLSLILLVTACGPFVPESPLTENAHSIGDVMTALDDAAGNSTGTFGMMAHPGPQQSESMPSMFKGLLRGLASGQTTSTVACSTIAFGGCTSVGGGLWQRIREFGGCMNSSYSYTGDVTLSFDNGSCAVSAGHTVTRTPNIVVEGRRNEDLQIYSQPNAESVTHVTGLAQNAQFTYSNTGVTRAFSTQTAGVNMTFTVQTTTDVTFTGSARLGSPNRQITGGVIEVTNTTTGSNDACSFSPDPTNPVSWTSDCRCPTVGKWKGNCSASGAVDVEFVGCGIANLTYTAQDSTGASTTTTTSVTLDRCF